MHKLKKCSWSPAKKRMQCIITMKFSGVVRPLYSVGAGKEQVDSFLIMVFAWVSMTEKPIVFQCAWPCYMSVFRLFGWPQMKALLNVSGLTTPLSWIGIETGWFHSIKEANLETKLSKVKHMSKFCFWSFKLKFVTLVSWTPFQRWHFCMWMTSPSIRTCPQHQMDVYTIAFPMRGQSMSNCGETR